MNWNSRSRGGVAQLPPSAILYTIPLLLIKIPLESILFVLGVFLFIKA